MANGPHPLDEDFVLLDDEDLPLRPKPHNGAPASTTPSIDLHNIRTSSREVLVSIQPPQEPLGGLQHTPCDIVLVIDVSASMNTAAEIPDNASSGVKESSGWSILDLVKHASGTILENLNENDRLAIVTFSTDARVIQGLLPMTVAEKAQTRSRLEDLTVHNSTNLWAGMREGLDIFAKTRSIGNAQGMYVLTDGVPNHLNPAQGFCKKLDPILRQLESDNGQAPIVSTFGFGYYLKSSLLRSIAEVGRGSYSFIPDAGMIGTVFVHAVANLFSTYATSAELILECSNAISMVEPPPYYDFNTSIQSNITTLQLGNIQYGQSRDIIVKVNHGTPYDTLKATLRYQIPRHGRNALTVRQPFNRPHTLPQTTVDYHISRHELCAFLSSLSFKSSNSEHVALLVSRIAQRHDDLRGLIVAIENRLRNSPPKADTTDLAALLADLKSSDPTEHHGHGQISLALQTTVTLLNASGSHCDVPEPPIPTTLYGSRSQPFYTRWGQHYLPSILHAHAYQLPMTFKDPGPLRYGIDSPLFVKCRDDLDTAFDKLPTPIPSLSGGGGSGSTAIGPATRGPSNGYVSYTNGGPGAPTPADPRYWFEPPRSGGPGAGAGAGVGVTGMDVTSARMRMSRFNRVDNPCFAGECQVRLAGGVRHVRVDEVLVGDILWTAAGARTVRDVVVTRVAVQEVIGLSTGAASSFAETGTGKLWVTPWHPVFVDGRWVFPCHVEGAERRVMCGGEVYSFLLERDDDERAHTVEVGGVVCVTLGHGLVARKSGSEDGDVDVRVHPFFGDYDMVAKSLQRLEKDDSGRRISGGIVKMQMESGMVACGFVRPDEAQIIRNEKVGIVKARL